MIEINSRDQRQPFSGQPAAPPPVVAPVQYATAHQKEEIIRLLNHPVITRPEKSKILLNINRFDEERAEQCLTKLRQVIDEREHKEPSQWPNQPQLATARNYSFRQLEECARRETGKRESFYKKLVESGKMTQEKADLETAMMHRLQRMMALLENGKFQLVNVEANTYYTEVPPL